MFSCRSRFFLRVEIGAGYLRFSRYGKSNAFFPVYLHFARAYDSQVQDSMSRSYRVRCRITSRPRKDDCFKK
jgi:hypothetical protein